MDLYAKGYRYSQLGFSVGMTTSVQLIVTPYLPQLPFFIFLSGVVTLVCIYFIMIEL